MTIRVTVYATVHCSEAGCRQSFEADVPLRLEWGTDVRWNVLTIPKPDGWTEGETRADTLTFQPWVMRCPEHSPPVLPVSTEETEG